MSSLKEIALSILSTLVVSTFIAWIVLNWISGCGEVFPTATGGYIHGECILHPFK